MKRQILGIWFLATLQSNNLALASNFIAEKATVSFLKIDEKDQTTTERNVLYKVKTCLKQDGKIVSNKSILLTSSQGKISTKSNANGCLEWQEKLRHKVYAPEQDYAQVTAIELVGLNAKINIPLFINPLKTNHEFGEDGRFLTIDRRRFGVKPAPALVLTNMTVHFNGSDYLVDSNLSLSLKRTYVISFLPEINRYDSQSNTLNRREKIRDGNYYLRATLLRGNSLAVAAPDGKISIIDSFEKLITVAGGQISTSIEFITRDLIAISSRNTLAIELYPVIESKLSPDSYSQLSDLIDFNSGIQNKIHLAPFIPSNEISSVIFPATREVSNMTELIVKAKIAKTQEEVTSITLDQYIKAAHEKGLSIIQPEDPLYDELKLDRKSFISLATNGLLNINSNKQLIPFIRTNLSNLCHKLIVVNNGLGPIVIGRKSQMPSQLSLTTYRIAKDCESNPEKYFNLSHNVNVLEVENSATKWLGGKSQSFNIHSSFDLSMNHTLNSTLREGVSANIGGSIKPLALFNSSMKNIPLLKDVFSASVDWGMTWDSSHTDSISEGSGHGVTFSRGLYLIEQQANVQIQINRYMPCLTVQLNEDVFAQIFSNKSVPHWLTHGYQFCASEIKKPIKIVENYFFFSQHFALGDFVDSKQPDNRPFVLSIRGLRDYYVFLSSTNKLLDAPQIDNAAKSNPQDLFLRGMELFAKEFRSIPGTYNSFSDLEQINFVLQNTESSTTRSFYNDLRQTLSPWARKELTPLAR